MTLVHCNEFWLYQPFLLLPLSATPPELPQERLPLETE